MTIQDCSFYNNKANTYGGSFLIRDSSVYISNSIFLQNHATQGGAMHLIQLLLVITLRGSIHKVNSAKQSGGALFTDQGARLYDNRSLFFFYNTATTGGALYARSGS